MIWQAFGLMKLGSDSLCEERLVCQCQGMSVPQKLAIEWQRGQAELWTHDNHTKALKPIRKPVTSSETESSRHRQKKVPGLFSVGYFPIVNFLKDISLSDKCQPRYLPIMELYPSCFAHQEKLPPGLIPITILPIYWRSSTHQIFTYHQIIGHQRKYNLVYYWWVVFTCF